MNTSPNESFKSGLPPRVVGWHRQHGLSRLWLGLCLCVLLAGNLFAAMPVVTVTPNATSIPRFEIYELTMAHIGTYTYPDFDVSITMVMTSPSNKTYTIGGFFYDPNTWKTRFAPKEVGNYTWTLTFDNGSGTPYATSGSFTCTASNNTGFLVIDPANNRRFITEGNGKPFFINGFQYATIDTPWHPTPQTGPTGESPVLVPLVDAFSAYRRAGLNIWRYNWQSQDAGSPYLTRINNAGSGKPQFNTYEGKRIDELLIIVHQSGLKHMQTLMTAAVTSNYDLAATGNSTALANYVKNFINRWGAYTDIWEIGNELNIITQPYLNVITSTFHNNDPYNHPLTNSYQAPALDESGLTAANSHSYKSSKNIDLDRDWVYSTGPTATGVGQLYGATVNGTYISSMRELYPNKPIFSGECGNASPYSTYDPERYRIPIWTANLNDSGVIYWLQFNKRAYQPANYGNMYIGTEERGMNKGFTNQTADLDDLIAPIAAANVVCSPSASVRGYVASSNQNVIGYFLHTTNHYSTISGATAAIPVPANNMRGQWIDPATGNILQSFTVNSGTQTLSMPTFQVDVALRLRPANSAPVIEFAKASHTTWENQGSATITVNRSNSSTGAVSVQYATSDGLALAGTNYTAASGTLNWADGDMSPKTFTLVLQDNGIADQDKDFQIFLSNPSGGAILGGNDNTLIAECDAATNFNPLISSIPTATATVGTAFTYTVLGTGSPTSFNAAILPGGLTVNTTTGVISGTPTTAGTYQVTLSATAAGGTGTGTLTLTVNPPLPVINSAVTASPTTSSPFSYTITATNSPTSFNATGLPNGLAVDTTTGIISGIPTKVGTYPVTLSAANVTGTGTKTLLMTVTTPGAPVISSAAVTTGTVGAAFNYTTIASNTPTSYYATGLPAGLSIDANTGVISGTPAATGVSSVLIYAVNGSGEGVLPLNLTIFQTSGGVRFVYEGFNFPTSTNISTSSEISHADFGLTGTTWTGAVKVIAGLTFTGIPSLGNAVQPINNVNAVRSFDTLVAPASITQLEADGVTRIGKPGTTIWVRTLQRVDLADSGNTQSSALLLNGAASGGGTKLTMGCIGTTGAGKWSVAHNTTVGQSGIPITVSQTVMLVARIYYGVGTNKDEVDFYVNPPTVGTPPATPDASLRNLTIGTIDKATFGGARQGTCDELSIGTDWFSAVAPNAQGFFAFNGATYSQHEGASGTSNATVTVTRTGGSVGTVSVHYATCDGTAVAGTDYTATSGTLTWADGDATDKTFSVPVIGTSVYAANMTVNLTLSAPTGGAAVGVQGTATLTLLNDNTPKPIPADDYVTANKNTQLADILVMANDTEPSGDTFSITSVGAPAHGTAQVNPNYNSTITYIPTTGYSGADAFTYTLTDSHGATATGNVHVTVLATPRLTIMPLGDSITAGASVSVTAQGYRGPLIDSLSGAGIPIQYTGTDNPGVYGVYDPAAMASEGHSGYTINAIYSNLLGNNSQAGNFGGYWLNGGNGTGRIAVSPDVVLLLIGANDASGAGTPSAAIMQGYLQNVLNTLKASLPNAQIFVASLTPRTDLAAKESVSVAYSAGIPSMSASMGSKFHFVDLHTNFPANGLDSGGLHPNQTGYDWIASKWSAAIQTILHPPVANADNVTTPVNTAATVSVLANDTDPDSDPLIVTAVGTPAHGNAVRNADNTVTYTPSANYSGADSFTYAVGDGRGGTATGTVNVTISAQGGYATWAAHHSLNGLNALSSASPAGDGLSNLTKYALGLDPNTYYSAAQVLPIGAIQTLAGTDYLTFTFTRNTQATDVTYSVEVTSDLSGIWDSLDPFAPVNQVSVIADTPALGIQTITVKDIQPVSSSPRRFMRLQLVLP